jgi:hypothetical protein
MLTVLVDMVSSTMNHAIYQSSYCSLRRGHIPFVETMGKVLTISVKTTGFRIKPMTQQQHEHHG